jgi:hypothetical protein
VKNSQSATQFNKSNAPSERESHNGDGRTSQSTTEERRTVESTGGRNLPTLTDEKFSNPRRDDNIVGGNAEPKLQHGLFSL